MNDPGVENEPHFDRGEFRPDPSEERAARDLSRDRECEDDSVAHSVWDEPGLSRELVGKTPEDATHFAEWALRRRKQTSTATTWLVTAGIVACAGPFAILGAFMGTGGSVFGLLLAVVVAPVVEETMKNGLALIVVETRPFLFRSKLQIGICALVAGLAFAAIENLMYLHVYIPNPESGLVLWRWTICVALHTGCALIGALGVMRMWQDVWRDSKRANVNRAFPYLATAAVIHGVYNLLAVLAGMTGFGF
jgi:hypothetical protein